MVGMMYHRKNGAIEVGEAEKVYDMIWWSIKAYGVPVVVAINKFITDSDEEVKAIEDFCKNIGVEVSLTEVWEKGGEGGIDLANKVIKTMESEPSNFKMIYDSEESIKDKILKIVQTIYGGKGVNYTPQALKQIAEIEKFNLDKLPICMAKTQYSFCLLYTS